MTASWSNRDNGMPSFLLLGQHRFTSVVSTSLLVVFAAFTLLGSGDSTKALANTDHTLLAKASPADYQIAAKIKTHRMGESRASRKSNIRTHRAGTRSDQSSMNYRGNTRRTSNNIRVHRSGDRSRSNIRVRRVEERSGSKIRVHRQ